MTQANRQDIVIASPRNERIVEHIGHAFIQAVLELCEYATVRYKWMRFLPKKDHVQYSGLWLKLVDMIEENLNKEPVLLPRSENGLRKIKDLRIPCQSYYDSRGDPLFRDVEPEMWLSQHYERADIEILRAWGLHDIRTRELLSMVQQELSLPDSRMRSEDTDDDWHTKAANMLSKMALKQKYLSALRQLEIIPCRGSPTDWISQGSVTDPNTICLAESEQGVPVPDDLNLRVITSKASNNPERVAFFKRLGLEFADTSAVRHSILERHQDYLNPHIPNSVPAVQVVVDQLKFLCLTQHTDWQQEDETHQVILIDQYCNPWDATSDHPLYLRNNDPYGPRELLKVTKAGAPGLAAKFLHSCFLLPEGELPQKPTPDSETWSDWLRSYAGVHHSLRLTTPSLDDLSSECYYVAKHRPEKFLGLLRHHRLTASEDEDTPEWCIMSEKLEKVEVLCHRNRMVPFSETYLPLSHLQETCCRFLTEHHEFPFLKIKDTISRENCISLKWDFLIDFAGVSAEEDLAFYLAILGQLYDSAEDDQIGIRVVHLYSMIYTKYANVQLDSRDAERETRNAQKEQIK